MKKFFLLLMACCFALTMSAKVAYLLPNNCAYNGPSGDDADISGLASEKMDEVNQDPEWRAAQWFYDEYVNTGKGEFVAVADFGTKYSQFSTIWIHLDRANAAENVLSYYDNDSEFLNHLKAFTAGGGNLLLSKHASQLLGDGKLNRLVRPETVGSNVEQRFSPEYPRKGYDWNDGETKWFVSTKFNGRDNSNHPVFNNMQGGFAGNSKDVECLLVAAKKHHTDFNCGIPRDWIHVVINPDDNYETQKSKVDKFEEVCKCRIIGTWGGNEWMQYGGFVEFYPKGDDFKGTVLMYGLAAYNWCANNFGYAYENVQRMTRNGINYLENKDVKVKKGDLTRNIADLFLGEYNNKDLTSFPTLHPDIEGWNPVYSTSDESVAVCQDGKLKFKKAGTVTLHVDITEDRADQAWPKGTYRTDCQLTFSYADSEALQKIVEEDFPYDGRESGHSDRFSIMHEKVRGLTASNYTIERGTGDLFGEAEFVQDGDYKRLVFTTAGKVLVHFTLTESNIVETWPAGEHSVYRYLEFAFDKTEPTRGDLHIDDDFYANGREGGVANGDFMVLHPELRGTSATYTVTNGTGEAEVAEGLREYNRLAFTKAGKVTLHVSAQQVNKITKWPCGTYNFDKEITFAFDKTEPTRDDLYIDTDFYANGREGGVANGDFMVLHPELRGTSATYTVTNGTGEAEVAKGLRGRNRLAFTKAGIVTLHVSAQQANKITKWPCGTYNFDKEITFAFDKDINVVVNDLSSNGLDGETGKFMVLHKNMQGLDATYETSFDDIEKSNRAEVATIVDGDFNRLTFTKPGTVKLLVSLKYSDEHNTMIGKGVHVATKTVTFAQPAFTWTHQPDDAVVGEGKEAAQATCNVPGATVMYESSNAEIASINVNSGQITYIHIGTCDITAYTLISGVKYSSAPFVLNVGPLVYKRENVGSTFSTICLSREATAVSGVKKIYTLTGVKMENGTITNIVMDELEGTTMAAGTPYVIRTEGTKEAPVTISFYQEGVEAKVQPANGLMGTLENITIEANTNGHSGSIYYLATDGQLHRVSGSATVKIGANKAYFDLYDVDVITDPTPAPGRMFMAIDGAQPLPTALEGTAEGVRGIKIIRNGQLIIRRGECDYDVMGNQIK